MATSDGKSIRFRETAIRATGRRTKGVKGITISKSDSVIGMLVLKNDGYILVASENGYGKRSNLDEYRIQNRSGKGVYTLKSTDKTGKLVSILEVVDSDDIMIITNGGVMIRQSVSAIRTIGRNTQGVRLIKLDDGFQISSVTKVVKEEDGEEDDNGGATPTDINTEDSEE